MMKTIRHINSTRVGPAGQAENTMPDMPRKLRADHHAQMQKTSDLIYLFLFFTIFFFFLFYLTGKNFQFIFSQCPRM